MLSTHESIFDIVKQKLNRGSANRDANSYAGVKNRIEFMDRAHLIIAEYLARGGVPKISEKKAELYNYFLLALLAECFECGNCGEISALTFTECLKAKYPGSVEVLLLLTCNSILAADHFMIILNRDRMPGEKENIDIYKCSSNTKILDAWEDFIYDFSDAKLNLADKLYDIFGKSKDLLISSKMRIENGENFIRQNGKDLVFFLTQLKEFISSPVCKGLLEKKADKWLLDMNFEEFREKMLSLIKRDIFQFKSIASPFIVKHWDTENMAPPKKPSASEKPDSTQSPEKGKVVK